MKYVILLHEICDIITYVKNVGGHYTSVPKIFMNYMIYCV